MNNSIKKVIIYIIIVVFSILYLIFGYNYMRRNRIHRSNGEPVNTVQEEKITEKKANEIIENKRKDESAEGLSAKVTMPFIYINSKPIKPSGNYVKKSLDEMIIDSVEYIYYVPSSYDSTYIEGFDGIENRCRISISISELRDYQKEFSTIEEYVTDQINTLSSMNEHFEYREEYVTLNGKEFLTYVEFNNETTSYNLTYIINDYAYTMEYKIYNKFLEKEYNTMIKVMESAMFIKVGKD